MNITCEMAQDLIALYFDGAASEDSRLAVEEHLRSCKTCAAAYAAYRRGIEASHRNPPPPRPSVSTEKYAELALSLRRRHQKKVAGVVALVAASMLLGAYLTSKILTSEELSTGSER